MEDIGNFPRSVLLVEDSPTQSRALQELFSRRGINAVLAADEAEALASVSNRDIGLALVDLYLGSDQSDGVDVAARIKAEAPETSIIFLSAFTRDPGFREKIERAGIKLAGFVEKPMGERGLDALVALVDDALLQRPSEVAVQEAAQPIEEPAHDLPLPAEEADGASVVEISTIDLLLYKALEAHPDLMKALDWRTFEKLMADIIETFGYSVELMQGTKDGGIDIIAFGRPEPWKLHKYIVQAKRWENRVGVEPVQRLLFLHDHLGATRSCLATTSTFTRGAWQLAQTYQWKLELQDYEGLRQWISGAIKLKEGR